MSDDADRHLAEQYLQGRLHSLARDVLVPVVPPGEDVRRGRRRLLRMRVALAGGTTATLAVALGFTGLTAGDPRATVIEPADGSSVTTLPSPTPSADPSAAATDDLGGGQVDGQGGGAEAGANGSSDTGLAGAGGDLGSGSPDGTTRTEQSSEAAGDDVATPLDHGPQSSASDDPTTAPTTEPTAQPTTQPTTQPTSLPTTQPTTQPTPADPPTTPVTDPSRVRIHATLRAYNRVLAERLDPGRDHLATYQRRPGAPQTTVVDGVLFALGTTYAWADGKGMAGLQVRVASGWDQVDWECGASYTDWSCRPAPNAATTTGATSAEVALHDGLRQVAVQHADGHVVVLTASPGYGSAQTTGSVDASDAALAAAASDSRLRLPGQAPVAPPRLDPESFAAAGSAALVLPALGETFVQTSIDRSPQVRGTWSDDDVDRGALAWSAAPAYSGAGWECRRQFRSCTEVVVGGHTVHVGLVRPRAGGGVVIAYAGPSYVVRVFAADRKLPRKRAYAFVTDGAWQPVR